jgi:hypothetical protein
MEYPSRCWSISRYIDSTGREVSQDHPDAIGLYSSREPTDEDKIRRKLASHEADRRLHQMKERIFLEETRQREQALRRSG